MLAHGKFDHRASRICHVVWSRVILRSPLLGTSSSMLFAGPPSTGKMAIALGEPEFLFLKLILPDD